MDDHNNHRRTQNLYQLRSWRGTVWKTSRTRSILRLGVCGFSNIRGVHLRCEPNYHNDHEHTSRNHNAYRYSRGMCSIVCIMIPWLSKRMAKTELILNSFTLARANPARANRTRDRHSCRHGHRNSDRNYGCHSNAYSLRPQEFQKLPKRQWHPPRKSGQLTSNYQRGLLLGMLPDTELYLLVNWLYWWWSCHVPVAGHHPEQCVRHQGGSNRVFDPVCAERWSLPLGRRDG